MSEKRARLDVDPQLLPHLLSIFEPEVFVARMRTDSCERRLSFVISHPKLPEQCSDSDANGMPRRVSAIIRREVGVNALDRFEVIP